MTGLINRQGNWIARWRGCRLIVMPLVVIGVGIWLSLIEGKSSAIESDRVRVFLIQVLEENALDAQASLKALDASEPIAAAEFRSRIRHSASALISATPLIEVKVGDFGVGALGNATHTALACYRGGAPIAVRVISIPAENRIKIVGVFTPDSGDFETALPEAPRPVSSSGAHR